MVQVCDVRADPNTLTVDLADGRSISAPLAWFPRLSRAAPEQLELPIEQGTSSPLAIERPASMTAEAALAARLGQP